ncbi:MAG TPA: hypothetical protein VFW94_24390 [Candidatus Acidoferrales bacterium]|nr:hypothetical protein [Candidatus Acidoferrales bacterium]
MKTLQFTIPASGVVQFIDPQAVVVGTYFQNAFIQNNNVSGNIRIGDNTVSATTGIVLVPGAILNLVLGECQRRTDQIFAYGAANATVDLVIVE